MFMPKRCRTILVFFCCCAVNNNLFGGVLYNFWQKNIGVLIDFIVPDIKDNNNNSANEYIINNSDDNNNIDANVINNVEPNNQLLDNTYNNSGNIKGEINSKEQKADNINVVNPENNKFNVEEFNKDFNDIDTDETKWARLIEMHYVWCAFYGTAIVTSVGPENTDNSGSLEEDDQENAIKRISLSSQIISFFNEPQSRYLSTLDGLKGFFEGCIPSYNNNFITQKITFVDFIRNNLEKFFKQYGVVKQIITSLLNSSIEDDSEQAKALLWIFSVALGLYYQKEFSMLVSRKLNNGFFTGDKYKKNSAAYIVKSFQERSILFQKFIAYFKLLYKLYGTQENVFIECVNSHMRKSFHGQVYWENFRNLLYRNIDKDGSHIDIVGNII